MYMVAVLLQVLERGHYSCLPLSFSQHSNGFYQRVARQQLSKHGPTRNNRGGYVSLSAVTSRSGVWRSRDVFPVMRARS
jgi:hypothetical protein